MSGYDAKLLADAGDISKGQRQAGYNIDILNAPPPSQTPVPAGPHGSNEFPSSSPVPPPGAAAPAIIGNTSTPGSFANKGMEGFKEELAPYPKKVPFYRTRKGMIIIAAIVVIIIAIAVGVGAGVGASNNKDSSSSDSNTGQSDFSSFVPEIPTITSGSATATNFGNGQGTARGGEDAPSTTSQPPASTSGGEGLGNGSGQT